MTGEMEIQESGEAKEELHEVSEEDQHIDDITFEPEAVVEREMDYKEAEAIEAAFVEVVQASSLGEATDPMGEEGSAVDSTASAGLDDSYFLAALADQAAKDPGVLDDEGESSTPEYPMGSQTVNAWNSVAQYFDDVDRREEDDESGDEDEKRETAG